MWSRKTFIRNAALLVGTLASGLGFLRLESRGAEVIRPPGALPEEDFLSTCIRCGRCGDACPNRAIVVYSDASGAPFSRRPGRGEDGTPVIFPRQQGCNLCIGAKTDTLLCTAACPSGALQVIAKQAEQIQQFVQMGKAVVDTHLCHSYNGASCGVCVRACPFEGKALKAGLLETPVIDPEQCVGCGLCERSCIRYPQAIAIVPIQRKRGTA